MSTPGISYQIIVVNATIQSVIETIIFVLMYALGVLGTFSLYLSGRQTIRARPAEMFFVAGIALISVAIALGYGILQVKCPPTGMCG